VSTFRACEWYMTCVRTYILAASLPLTRIVFLYMLCTIMAVVRLINVIPFERGAKYKRVTYEQVKKACGKPGCRTCRGTELAHGPYWQLVEWDEKGHRSRTRYVGKHLPEEAQEALIARGFLADPSFRRLVHQTDRLVEELKRREKEIGYLSHKVAGLEADLVDARARSHMLPHGAHGKLDRAGRIYRELAFKYHPDRNPASSEVMRDINQLWQALK